jgi:thiamine transporter ThiT
MKVFAGAVSGIETGMLHAVINKAAAVHPTNILVSILLPIIFSFLDAFHPSNR